MGSPRWAVNGTHLGHEGDDPHRLAAAGADEREGFIDTGEQHRPPIGDHERDFFVTSCKMILPSVRSPSIAGEHNQR